MDDQSSLRSHIVEQLTGQNAHAGLQKSIEGLERKDLGVVPEGCAHSVWMLVEHIRIAQYDVLDFSRNPNYKPLSWPDEYWPENPSPADQSEWNRTVSSIHKDRQQMVNLVEDTENDLLEPFPHGNGQTLFREAMLIVDHNAYHIGQIVQLRRIMGNW